MAKSPSGSRPTPRVTSGKGNSWNIGNKTLPSKSGTKAPTGNRPVPGVTQNTPKVGTKAGPVKKAIRNTPMPGGKVPGDKVRGSGNM